MSSEVNVEYTEKTVVDFDTPMKSILINETESEQTTIKTTRFNVSFSPDMLNERFDRLDAIIMSRKKDMHIIRTPSSENGNPDLIQFTPEVSQLNQELYPISQGRGQTYSLHTQKEPVFHPGSVMQARL